MPPHSRGQGEHRLTPLQQQFGLASCHPPHCTSISRVVQGLGALTSIFVSLFKTLLKLLVLLAVGAIVAGVIFAVKRQKDTGPLSFEEWPSVPRNPDA
jgi:hypothetical protein